MLKSHCSHPEVLPTLLLSGLLVLGCSNASNETNNGGGGTAPVGGVTGGRGGASGGGLSTGGTAFNGSGVTSGGTSPTTSGIAGTGGAVPIGGTANAATSSHVGGQANLGGVPLGGSSTNTKATGGRTASGGSSALGSQAGNATATTAGRATGGRSTSGGTAPTGGKPSTGGNTAMGGTSSATTTVGVAGASGASSSTQCSSALPSGAQPADISSPTTVVGSGTGASCTFAELDAAITKGGIITFDCGPEPVTIAVTATMNLPNNKNTVIDGGNKITLDGEGKAQILHFEHGDWMVNDTRVTLQHLALINGKTTPNEQIPTAPAPCSQGWNDGEGGALYMRDGNLTVIDCRFSNNQAAPLGPDTGGGAIYINGSKHGALIVGSVFVNNSGSNAGAVGGLFAELQIYNSLFQNNKATGNGANSDDPAKCSAINNGQHEVGSGGNGAAIYQDGGASTNIVLCGVEISGNAAGTGAFGGGVFMTSNDWSGTLSIQDCKITGNTGGSWTQVQQGSVTNLGSAFGVNALSVNVKNSTLQDVR